MNARGMNACGASAYGMNACFLDIF